MILAAVIFLNMGYFFSYRPPSNPKARVISVLEEENDGGIVTQNLIIELLDSKEEKQVSYELLNPELTRLRVNDIVSVNEIEEGQYEIVGLDRGILVLVIALIALLLVLVSIGFDDLKELSAVLLIIPFIASGLFGYLIANINILIILLTLAVILTWISAYLISSKVNVAVVATVSNLLTLIIVLALNLAMFKILRIGDVYYNYIDIRINMQFDSFWQLFNVGVILVTFGTILNNTIILSRRAESLFSEYMSPSQLIKKLTYSSQNLVARRINIIFFLFLGLSVIPISISSQEGLWNSSRVLEYLVLFISSVFAVILSVFLTAVISAVYLNLTKKEQIRIFRYGR